MRAIPLLVVLLAIVTSADLRAGDSDDVTAAKSAEAAFDRALATVMSMNLRAAGSDDVAAAKSAETAFHHACNQWAVDAAAGQDPARSAERITRAYSEFWRRIRTTRYRESVNNALLLPHQFASAGAITRTDGSQWSYTVGTGQSGLVMSVWKREGWQADGVPPNGFAASLGIEPEELQAKFSVGRGTWLDFGQNVLRIPYRLGDQQGKIDIVRVGDKWEIRPDRGEIRPGGWWRPGADGATSRPAE